MKNLEPQAGVEPAPRCPGNSRSVYCATEAKLAEDVGFEPTRRGQPDRSAFEIAAIDLSANLPEMVPQGRLELPEFGF